MAVRESESAAKVLRFVGALVVVVSVNAQLYLDSQAMSLLVRHVGNLVDQAPDMHHSDVLAVSAVVHIEAVPVGGSEAVPSADDAAIAEPDTLGCAALVASLGDGSVAILERVRDEEYAMAEVFLDVDIAMARAQTR